MYAICPCRSCWRRCITWCVRRAWSSSMVSAGGARTFSRRTGRAFYNTSMIPTHPQRRPELLVERAGRETLVYTTGQPDTPNAAEGAVHTLNTTASLIWDLCDGQHSLDEIERAVRQAFAVPAERDLAADVRGTI